MQKSVQKATALLFLIGLLTNCNSFTKAYVLDDFPHLVTNQKLKNQPMEYIGFGGERWAANATFVVSHWLGKGTVGWHHTFNLAIHIVAALALFGIVRRTLLLEPWRERYGEKGTWIALAVALLWMVHPLQTQAVTYLIQRHESQMGMFYLLTLYFFLRGATSSRHWPWFVLAVGTSVLGMGTKQVMFTAPFLIFLFDWVFLAGSFREAFRKRWGVHFALATTLLVLWPTFQAAFAPGPGKSAGFGVRTITSQEYLFTQPGVLLRYLELTFWPSRLSLDYDGWPVTKNFQDAVLPGLVIVGLLVATAFALYFRPWIGYLGIWFFGVLSITSSFVPIADVAFEHRMYLSLAAVAVLVVIVADGLVQLLSTYWNWSETRQNSVSLTLLASVVVALCIRTGLRNHDFRSVRAINEKVLLVIPESGRAHNNLGSDYLKMGETERALELLRKGTTFRRGSPAGIHSLGQAMLRSGDQEAAIDSFQHVLRIVPSYYYSNLELGRIRLQEGKSREAAQHLVAAAKSKPEDVLARVYLAAALNQLGRNTEAEKQHRKLFELDPDWPMLVTRRTLSRILEEDPTEGTKESAVIELEQANRATHSKNPEILNTLATAQAAIGLFDQAVTNAENALILAKEAGLNDLARDIKTRVALFKKRKAFTQENVREYQGYAPVE